MYNNNSNAILTDLELPQMRTNQGMLRIKETSSNFLALESGACDGRIAIKTTSSNMLRHLELPTTFPNHQTLARIDAIEPPTCSIRQLQPAT